MAQNRNTGDKRKIELLTNTYSIQIISHKKREADSLIPITTLSASFLKNRTYVLYHRYIYCARKL